MREHTKKKLIEAGWFEGRNIEIDEIIKKYMEREFELSAQNIVFLKEYGLLEFALENRNPLFNNIVYKHFNPIKALGKNLYKKSLEYLEDEYAIGNTVEEMMECIIGENRIPEYID